MPRPVRRRRRLLLFGIGSVALLFVARFGGERLFPTLWSRASSATSPLSRRVAFVAGPVKVLRVATGDTLVVEQEFPAASSGGKPTVVVDELRLLGIVAPEDSPHCDAAAAWLKEAVRGNVWLELDKRRVNRTGQFLAYVYIDGRLLNAELLQEGLARIDPYPGDNITHARNSQRAEQDAQRAGRGIWAAHGGQREDE